MKQEILKASELCHKYIDLSNKVTESIVSLMKSNGVTEVDFTLDSEGRASDDEEYDEDWVMDNRVYTVCFGKYYALEGYVSKVKVLDCGLDLTSMPLEDDVEYSHDYTDTSCGVLIDVLDRLEKMFNK